MIIDCHCHAGKGDIMTAPWNTAADLGPYLRRARKAGIERTVVFAPFHRDYAVANEQVASIVRRHAGRLTGFAFVHARRDAGRIYRMVETAVRRWGFRGIKIHGYDAMPTREVCDTARAFGIPILVDVVGQPHVIDMLAPEFPDVNFIVPHLGSFHDDWRAQQRVVEQVTRYANVYTDTSGVRRFGYIVEAIRKAGARKVLFGSDGPWLHPGVELYKVKALGLPREAERLVLGGNIARLIKSVRKPAARPRMVAAVSRSEPVAEYVGAEAGEREL